jgi:exonuclease III
MIDFKFDFICLTESKIQNNIEPKVNINIDGYKSPVGVATEAEKGGVLIYAKSGIDFFPRDDLSSEMYKAKELESLFIEVVNPKGANSVIGVIYRHPCMNPITFIDD